MTPEQRASRTVPYNWNFFGANRIKPERDWNLCPIRALRELGGLARRGGDRLRGAGRHFLRIVAPTQRHQVG